MAYLPHYLLSFGGHPGHIEEIWNCGIRLAVEGLENPLEGMDEEQYLTDTAVPALSAWFARADSRIANAAALKWIKFNAIGPDGRYVDQGITHQRSLTVQGGSGGTQVHPYQVAICLSWRNNEVARGPGSHGRIYSPRPATASDPATGDIAGGERVVIAASAVTLLQALDVSIGVPPGQVLRPVIASNVGAGVNRQIDRVVVDSAFDIQRRRANSQSREVTSAPVTY